MSEFLIIVGFIIVIAVLSRVLSVLKAQSREISILQEGVKELLKNSDEPPTRTAFARAVEEVNVPPPIERSADLQSASVPATSERIENLRSVVPPPLTVREECQRHEARPPTAREDARPPAAREDVRPPAAREDARPPG